MSAEGFVPAAGRAAFTQLYEPAMRLTMREGTVRPALAAGVVEGLAEGATIVDIGCGPGLLLERLAALRPDARLVGVEPDAALRPRAARRAGSSGMVLDGLADALPLPDASAERVVLSLVLHHLAPAAKASALAEARRVLRPGARLVVCDWGAPRGVVPRAGAFALRALDGVEGTADHHAGRLGAILGEGAVRRAAWATVWGTLELWSAEA